jgi:hypothetical protein
MGVVSLLTSEGACTTAESLNLFEKRLHVFWGTESPTNKMYIQTQAYRIFRMHVLMDMQNQLSHPLSQLADVTCHLCDNHILTFRSTHSDITLSRFLQDE